MSIICGCRAAGRYRRQEGQLTLAMIAQRCRRQRRTRAGDPKDLVSTRRHARPEVQRVLR